MMSVRLGIVAAAAAGLGGLVLGMATSPSAGLRSSAENAGEFASSSAKSPPSPAAGALPAFANASPPQAFERMLGAILNGDKKQVMDALQIVFSDPSLPPIPAEIYRGALFDRLAKLGGLQALLESNQYPASERPAVLEAVVRSLAETDTPAAEALIKKLTPPDRMIAAAALMEALGRTDPKRGLALIEADPQMRPFASALFSAWAMKDPRPAAEAAFATTEGEFHTNQRSVISAWVARDPAAAWKWIEAQPPLQQRIAKEGYFQALVWADPSKALEEMATRPEFADRFEAQWIGLSIAANPKEAAAAVDRLPPGQGRSQLIAGIARAASGNPEETIAWAKTLLPGERDRAMKELFEGLGWQDPSRALEIASTKLDGAARQQAIGSIIGGWANKDFDAAFETMITKLDRESMRAALDNVFMYHTTRDEAEVAKQLSMVAKLEPDVRQDVLRAMGVAWASQSGHTGSLQQIATLGADEQAAFAVGVMERSLDPSAENIAKIAAMLSPEQQAKYALGIARPMARADLAGTAEFLSRLPDGGEPRERRLAMDVVMRQWAYLEPGNAIAFVGGLPAGAAKDLASQALVAQLRNFDLEQATQVAGAVVAKDARKEVIEQLAGDWARVDAARGREAMAPLLTTDEDRAHAAALYGKK